MKVVLTTATAAEYDTALDYYLLRSLEAASGVIDDYDAAVLQLLQFPNAGSKTSKTARRLLFRHFPFQLIYRIEQDQIVLYALAHTSRRPGYWRKRLSKAQ